MMMPRNTTSHIIIIIIIIITRFVALTGPTITPHFVGVLAIYVQIVYYIRITLFRVCGVFRYLHLVVAVAYYNHIIIIIVIMLLLFREPTYCVPADT